MIRLSDILMEDCSKLLDQKSRKHEFTVLGFYVLLRLVLLSCFLIIT